MLLFCLFHAVNIIYLLLVFASSVMKISKLYGTIHS